MLAFQILATLFLGFFILGGLGSIITKTHRNFLSAKSHNDSIGWNILIGGLILQLVAIAIPAALLWWIWTF